jgi:lipoprotein-releasing system permease protein
MSAKRANVPRLIALRYLSVGKRSHLVSFISVISIFGLALGVAILITVLSVMNGFDHEMRENVLGVVPHITISSRENLSLGQWQQIELSAAQHPAVTAVAPVIDVAGVMATGDGNKAVLISGINPESESAVSSIAKFIHTGSLQALQNKRWGVVVGETLASRLAITLSDKVDIFSAAVSINPLTPQATFKRFEVVGIFKVGSLELDSELALINLSSARVLFKIRPPYNGLRIRTSEVLNADKIRLELAKALPATVSVQSWTAALGGIYNNIKFSRSIISFMLWLLIGVAAFNLVVSLIMIVRDKRGDIAILRTLGASPAMINRIFMWQGCLIGAIGILIGVALGVVGSLKISDLATAIESRFSIQLLNAEVYPIDFLPSQLNYGDVLMVTAGVLLLSFLATLYPARRAAAVQPADALRTE